MTEQESLEEQIDQLQGSLGQAANMASGFDSEMRRINATFSATGQQAKSMEKAFSSGLRRAIDGVVFDGFRLSDALESLGQSLINAAYKAAVKPVTDHVGGLLSQGVSSLFGSYAPFADGAPFTQGRVMPFASGGVVSGPVSFPMRGGMGLMGEAGPEAIMPLARGADGKLGVRASGGAPVTVVMNISTPDVAGFRRSESQIAAQASRALARAHRNS